MNAHKHTRGCSIIEGFCPETQVQVRTVAQVSPGIDEEQMHAGEDGWVPTDWVWSCPRHTGTRTGACVHGIEGGGFLQSIGCQTVSFAPFEIESGY